MKVAIVALFAASAIAGVLPSEAPSGSVDNKFVTSTVYATQVHTIIDCPPEVTDCPADKVKVVTKTVPVSTTICPAEEVTKTGSFVPTKPTKKPAPKPTEDCDEEDTGKTSPKPTHPAVVPPAQCGTTKVKTISTSITKVIPTVIYETVTEGCPEPTKGPAPTKNTTYPAAPKPSKPVVAGASSIVGSVLFAAAAGVAAFAFA